MQYKFCIRKDKLKNLIIWMTKPPVPQGFIKNNRLDNIAADFRRQSKMGGLMRIDGINSIFTLALVENLPCVQSLNGQETFIKITPAMVVMTDFMDKG